MMKLRNIETNVRILFLKRGHLWHMTAEGECFDYNDIYDV